MASPRITTISQETAPPTESFEVMPAINHRLPLHTPDQIAPVVFLNHPRQPPPSPCYQTFHCFLPRSFLHSVHVTRSSCVVSFAPTVNTNRPHTVFHGITSVVSFNNNLKRGALNPRRCVNVKIKASLFLLPSSKLIRRTPIRLWQKLLEHPKPPHRSQIFTPNNLTDQIQTSPILHRSNFQNGISSCSSTTSVARHFGESNGVALVISQ